MLKLTGATLDGETIEFELADIGNVYGDDDVLYVGDNAGAFAIAVRLSSVRVVDVINALDQVSRLNDWLAKNEPDLYHAESDTATSIIAILERLSKPEEAYMNKIDELFPGFPIIFASMMQRARESGAVSDEITDKELGRCVLQIVAEQYAPMSHELKRELVNLRHFIS